jgi:oxazoline/thiazoline dehydrogenase
VMDRRRSVYQYASLITVDELSAFLYHTARLKQLIPDEQTDLVVRPYPAGGALHELELYLAVQACEGLDPGLYHYETDTHALRKLAHVQQSGVKQLVDYAAMATGNRADPQVLVIMAARFERITWKYETMAYALVLKHVGILMQSMYLVATALNLSPCAIGGGDSDQFAWASGLDYFSEGAVGEFLLGGRPA